MEAVSMRQQTIKTRSHKMKRFLSIIAVIAMIFLSSPAYAVKNMSWNTLEDINGTAISSYALTGDYVASTAINNSNNAGYSSFYLSITSGQVDIHWQVSYDGITWESPYTTDGSSLTAVGSIASNVTASRWIVLPYRAAPYIRFLIYKDTNANISAYYIQQNEQ